MVMWVAAPMINSTKKTDVIGTSTLLVGLPPRDHTVGRYGGLWFIFRVSRVDLQ
jgi:hypothetical protein